MLEHKKWRGKSVRPEDHSILVVVEPTPVSVDTAPVVNVEPKVEQSKSMIRATWVMAATSTLMFIATIAMAFTTHRQWEAAIEQIKQTVAVIDQMKTDHAAAQKQSDATISQMKEDHRVVAAQLEQNESVLEHMRLEQRAWVSVINPSLAFEIGKPLSWELVLHNSGQTPALVEQISSQMFVRGYSEAFDCRAVQLVDSVRSHWSLAPGESRLHPVATRPASLTQEQYDAVKGTGKTRSLYVVGKIHYRDVANEPRNTEYCLTYEPGTGQLRFYHQHNRMY